LGDGPAISVFSGHMEGDTQSIVEASLTPMLNSAQQMQRHFAALPDHPFGIQLDTGMNRLGMEPAEWAALRSEAIAKNPTLLMSHLACADEPDDPMNAQQRAVFEEMTQDTNLPRSLAATGGTLLGAAYHYDMVRPGIGLYGGEPFAAAKPVVALDIPVIQIRDVALGETVGYGKTWTATQPSKIATIAAGYADGLIRAMGPRARLHADGIEVPVVGRVSMDLITVDVTALPDAPQSLRLLGAQQSVDEVANFAGTIGYEILTSIGARYRKSWTE
jgi:alanine racemase